MNTLPLQFALCVLIMISLISYIKFRFELVCGSDRIAKIFGIIFLISTLLMAIIAITIIMIR